MIYFGDDKMPDFTNRQYPFHFANALNLLMKMGVNIDRVEILAIGEFENYKGEIREQQPPPGSPIKSGTKITLKVGYPSAVDQLPYQFFYGLQGSTPRSGEWDLDARRVMAPYDATVIRHEADLRYQTLKFSFGVADQDHLSRFLDLFGFDRDGEVRNLEDLIIWASLLPSFHLWGGNLEKVAEVLHLLFGHRFRIVENVRAEYDIPESIRYHLGAKSGRLGRESIIGRSFSEYDSTYQVIISDITRKEIAAFVPGGTRRKKLEWVLGLCMPNDLDYRISFDVKNRALVVGEREEGAYLGYATHLQRGGDEIQQRRRAVNKAAQ
jgi:hypothetical protein